MGEEVVADEGMCDVGHHELSREKRSSPRLSLKDSHPQVGMVVPLVAQRS
jgi:hypothetical protein